MIPQTITKEAEAVTCVWWDINRCPLPGDVEVRRVGPCIKRALEKLGYSGPLTITAIGILTDVPHDFLREIYSSGIAIHHVPTDVAGLGLDVLSWTWSNRAPANIMLISGEPIFLGTLASLSSIGYNIVRSISSNDPQQAASDSASDSSERCFLWESLLASLRADAMDSVALQEEKCGETGEPALYCSTCDVHIKGFEKFTTHLMSKEHAQESQYFRNEDDEEDEEDYEGYEEDYTDLEEDE